MYLRSLGGLETRRVPIHDMQDHRNVQSLEDVEREREGGGEREREQKKLKTKRFERIVFFLH